MQGERNRMNRRSRFFVEKCFKSFLKYLFTVKAQSFFNYVFDACTDQESTGARGGVGGLVSSSKKKSLSCCYEPREHLFRGGGCRPAKVWNSNSAVLCISLRYLAKTSKN